MAHGYVAVDGEQAGEPGGAHAEQEHERVHPPEDIPEHPGVRPAVHQTLAEVPHGAQQHGTEEDHGVGHGETLEQYAGGEALLLHA